MQEWLIDILRNPHNGNKLVRNGNEFVDEGTNARFSIKENIPIFTEKETKGKTALHKELDTEFHYVEHYREDAFLYDYFKEEDAPAMRHKLKRFHQSILKEIPSHAQTILDVGCGSAWIAQALIPEGKRVVSMDIAFTNTQKALEKTPSPQHVAVVADVFNLPFAEHSFDCITACEIMEHTYDPPLFMEKLWLLLKPGGTLIVSVPYKEKIEYYLCVHCNKPTPRNAHLHSFDKEKLQQLGQPLATKKVTIRTVGNTILIKLRTHVFLQYLPFSWWKGIDTFFTKLVDKAEWVVAVLSRPSDTSDRS